MGVAPTRKENKVMRLTIDVREVESLSIELANAKGKNIQLHNLDQYTRP